MADLALDHAIVNAGDVILYQLVQEPTSVRVLGCARTAHQDLPTVEASLSNEPGIIHPGVKAYHALAEIRPFSGSIMEFSLRMDERITEEVDYAVPEDDQMAQT